MSQPTIKITKDFTDNFNDIIERFKHDSVLVGIPEAETQRKSLKPGEVEPINNATLLALNNFGSPINNVPARPVMEIGIANAQEAISDLFKKAVKDAFKNGVSAIAPYYERAGMVASGSIKKAINDQEGIDAPAESTIKSRRSKGFKGIKALIVTAQMRNAITYVMRIGRKR